MWRVARLARPAWRTACLDGALQDRLVEVVAALLHRSPGRGRCRVAGRPTASAHSAAGVRVLPGQRVGQLDPAGAGGEVDVVLGAGRLEVLRLEVRTWRSPAAS